MAPVLLECLIIMTFFRVILAPLIKNVCIRSKKKKKKGNAATSFSCTFLKNKASESPQL